MRLAALGLLRMGVAGEVIAISGMIFGIVAGVCFLFTSETERPSLFWLLALACCVLRILALRIEGFMRASSPENLEDDYQQELPERVSDAVTLIGFGFAAQSNPWLGLASSRSDFFSLHAKRRGKSWGDTERSSFRAHDSSPSPSFAVAYLDFDDHRNRNFWFSESASCNCHVDYLFWMHSDGFHPLASHSKLDYNTQPLVKIS